MAATLEVNLLTDISSSLKEIEKFQKESVEAFDAIQKEVKDTNKVTNKFNKDTAKATKQTARSFNGLLTNFNSFAASVTAYVSARALINFFKESITAAAAQEQAINDLNTSLRLAGEFSNEASQGFQDFASALQQNSRFGDEVILQQLALARNFARTNDEAQSLVKAAVDLSEATGLTLDGAVRNLGKTFSGLTGELGESVPQLRALTAEQLRAGDAIQVISERFGGAAAQAIRTFGGAAQQTRNTFGDLLESIGALVTQNPLVIKSVNLLNKLFLDFQKSISANEETLISLVNRGIVGIAKAVPDAVKAIQFFNKALTGVEIIVDSVLTLLGALGREVANLISGNFSQIGESVGNSFSIIQDEANANLEAFIESDKVLQDLAKSAANFATEVEKAAESTTKLVEDTPVKVPIQPTLDPQEIQKILQSPGAAGIDLALDIRQINLTQAEQTGLAFGTGFLSNALKGAEGARNLFSQAASGAAAAAFGPAFGPVAGEIVSVLAQGPEKVRETINSFVDAIPTIIVNIVESIPALVQSLVFEGIPRLIDGFVAGLPTIVRGFLTEFIIQLPVLFIEFANGLRDAALELVLIFPQIAVDFVTALVEDAPRFITALVEGIGSALSGGLLGGDGPLSGIGDTIGGAVGAVGDFLGFENGGRVPDVGRFANDGAIIRASAGEQILDRDLTSQLEQFLNTNTTAGGGVQNANITLQIGEQQLANVLVNLNRQGFRTA